MGGDILLLDLVASENWQPPEGIEAAIICAGATKVDECKRDPIGTRLVNVDGVSKLAHRLRLEGVMVLYLSTNQVFDGSKPFCQANEQYSPITEYGRQKAQVEDVLLSLGDSVAVLRLSKVLGPVHPLFKYWKKQLQSRVCVEAFSDMVVSPVPLNAVVSLIQLMVEQARTGVWQMSAAEEITYAEVAKFAASLLGASPGMVRSVKSTEACPELERVPAHTTLDIDPIRSSFGFQPANIWWTLENAFLNPNRLGSVPA
jgi:dTDP-4-dehydrorhamnose reductase